jgi:hypothetical protein
MLLSLFVAPLPPSLYKLDIVIGEDNLNVGHVVLEPIVNILYTFPFILGLIDVSIPGTSVSVPTPTFHKI